MLYSTVFFKESQSNAGKKINTAQRELAEAKHFLHCFPVAFLHAQSRIFLGA
jgi:hypothetical protein